MRITLYQNCILTDAYSEVFDVFLKDDNDKTALERYLETLPQTTYEVEDVFITNAGKFTFVAGDNASFYNFNYMKVEDTDNNITRYAFIETITIVNGLAVVNYIEDTWSNYASSMKIRNSLLTRSRIVDYGETIYGRMKIPFYTIGMPYESNERPKLICGTNGKVVGDDAPLKNCNVVLTVQFYLLSQSGEVSERQTYTVMLGAGEDTTPSSTLEYLGGQWLELLTRLQIASSAQKVTTSTGQFNYEITSVYLVPSEFNVSSVISQTNILGTIVVPEIETTGGEVVSPDTTYALYRLHANDLSKMGELIELPGYVFSNDFKRIGIGTISQPFTITNNGTEIDVSIYMSSDDYTFSLYMGVQGQLVEITDSYTLKIPVSVQTADVTQQQRTARAVDTLNGTLQMIGGITSIANGSSSMDLSKRLLSAGQQSGKLGSEIAGMHAVQGSVGSIVGGATSFIRGLTNVVTTNLPMFTTNKGISIFSNAVLNACYGIVQAVLTPDNEAQVVRYTNESGYICNEIVDTKIFTDIQTGVENQYNVVMFDYVKLYGKFSQRIASVLREILTNGVKIWYDETAINE